jgi:endogenous inhibitor of DNA gyrase (YacG/DUF329 family)
MKADLGGTMSKYKCPACKKTIKRDSDMPRHRSFCTTKGKMVTMTKVKK